MTVQLSRAVARILNDGWKLASDLGYSSWGSDHILLAIVRQSNGPSNAALRTLQDAGVTPDQLQRLIVSQEPPDATAASQVQPSITAEAEEVVRRGQWLAALMQRDQMTVEDLLLGILWTRDSLAALVLEKFGLTFEDAYQQLTGKPPPQEIVPSLSPNIEYGPPVYIANRDFNQILSGLPEVLPPGTPYAFNEDEDGRIWFCAEKGIHLEEYIERALDVDLSRIRRRTERSE